jgi:hypothetical protein
MISLDVCARQMQPASNALASSFFLKYFGFTITLEDVQKRFPSIRYLTIHRKFVGRFIIEIVRQGKKSI